MVPEVLRPPSPALRTVSRPTPPGAHVLVWVRQDLRASRMEPQEPRSGWESGTELGGEDERGAPGSQGYSLAGREVVVMPQPCPPGE